jgi:hypothetical protein
MKFNKILYFLIIALVFSIINACGINSNHSLKLVNFENDTVKYIHNKNIDMCFNFTDTFYETNGILISNNYLIEDSINIDLNKDGLSDCLIVLTPKYLLPDSNTCILHDSVCYRLLVEVINENNKYRIRNTYPNLISGIGGVLSPYNGMFITNDGFKIIHQAGSRYSWEYSVYFSSNKDKISLFEISKKCSFEDKDTVLNYKYNNSPLESFSINDTINQNCNCDVFWNKLENKE